MRQLVCVTSLCLLLGLVPLHAQTQMQTQDQSHQRLEQDIEKMQRDILERNRAAQQRAQEQIEQQERRQQDERMYQERHRDDEERLRREQRLLDQNNGVILVNPPQQRNDVIIVQPPSQERVIWVEPIIPNLDHGTIILRGQFDLQPAPQCVMEQWRENGALYQRWHCP
jgi:ATPase subunit of ABC transporter with duplicated ATPase domains